MRYEHLARLLIELMQSGQTLSSAARGALAIVHLGGAFEALVTLNLVRVRGSGQAGVLGFAPHELAMRGSVLQSGEVESNPP
jgi:hypothetical protein